MNKNQSQLNLKSFIKMADNNDISILISIENIYHRQYFQLDYTP